MTATYFLVPSPLVGEGTRQCTKKPKAGVDAGRAWREMCAIAHDQGSAYLKAAK